MATKQDNLHLEIAHFNQFKTWLPGYQNMHHLTVHDLLAMGLIEVSTAFETAIAHASGTEVISKDTYKLLSTTGTIFGNAKWGKHLIEYSPWYITKKVK